MITIQLEPEQIEKVVQQELAEQLSYLSQGMEDPVLVAAVKVVLRYYSVPE